MSFGELLVVIIVGLIIVGPDRLPQAIKSGIVWLNRIKRIINDTRTEFEHQLGVDEIRREIHNEQVLASLKALEEAKKNLRETGQQIDSALQAPEHTEPASDKNPEPRTIKEDFENDEHLYGEQLGNHPERVKPESDEPESTDTPSKTNKSASE